MLLEGKKALIMGVANEKSIAYGVAYTFKEQGAKLALSYPNDALQKRVDRASVWLGGDFTFQCDVTNDDDLQAARKVVEKKWGHVDILVHSIAFANRDDLKGRFLDTSREGWRTALEVSAYSLVAVAKAFEDLLIPGSSILTMTYLGSTRAIPNYNVMGIAKAALEACVRYLAVELGKRDIRINAISAGPIKTLAAAGISGMKTLLRHVEGKAPLGRNVTQDDVAKTALFLTSELASGVTGDIIFVDSGFNILGV